MTWDVKQQNKQNKKQIQLACDSPLYISRGVRLYVSKNIVFFCLKIFFNSTNRIVADEMPHYAAFHLGLHCLQKYSFSGFPNTKGKIKFLSIKL